MKECKIYKTCLANVAINEMTSLYDVNLKTVSVMDTAVWSFPISPFYRIPIWFYFLGCKQPFPVKNEDQKIPR